MSVLYFILLLLGAVCFASGWSGWPLPPGRGVWGHAVPAGLLFWIMVPLIHAAQALG